MIEAIAAHEQERNYTVLEKIRDFALGMCISIVLCIWWCETEQGHSIYLSVLKDKIPSMWYAYCLALAGLMLLHSLQRMQRILGGAISATGIFALFIHVQSGWSTRHLQQIEGLILFLIFLEMMVRVCTYLEEKPTQIPTPSGQVS